METRVFETLGKFNCVDTNGVFVGYDLQQDCCEQVDYYFASSMEGFEGKMDRVDTPVLNGFTFDRDFFVDWSGVGNYDETNRAAFRLVNQDGGEIYLILENCHNGYYAHGFEFCHGETVIRKGCL